MHENDTNALPLAAAAADCDLAFAFAAMSACIVAASLFVSFSLLLDLVHSHSAQHPHMCTRMQTYIWMRMMVVHATLAVI